jgi:hypothetical protein
MMLVSKGLVSKPFLKIRTNKANTAYTPAMAEKAWA